jgi:hypothetical protein
MFCCFFFCNFVVAFDFRIATFFFNTCPHLSHREAAKMKEMIDRVSWVSSDKAASLAPKCLALPAVLLLLLKAEQIQRRKEKLASVACARLRKMWQIGR